MNTELRDLILSRCVEVGDCLEWQGGLNSAGHPVMTYRQYRGGMVRRMLADAMDRDIEGKVLRMKCMNKRCINPEHTLAGTRQQACKQAGKAGRLSAPTKRLRCYIARMRWAKLTPEKIADIRASSEPDRVLAARHNVSIKTINDARRGLSHKATLPMGMGALA